MKYIELKKQLKINIDNVYFIYGDDRYLCFDALKKVESALSIQIKDMNTVTLSGESVTAKDIVESANTYPFGDLYRLVVVKNYEPKTKEDKDILQKYLKNPLNSTVLIFFNIDGSDGFKGIDNLTKIDCSKIDAKVITAFITNELAKNNIASNQDAINSLILYCSNDMSKVTNELEKLISYVYETKVLTEDIVKNFVARDKEFQVYQLAEFIAKEDMKNAFDLVEQFSLKSNTGFQIITTLYNNYRRALFISLNKEKTPSEMASLLGVKEFSIKMLKNQIQYFTSKQLKRIVDIIARFDKKIKNGEIKENIAIKTIIFNILDIKRGYDD
ncbi:MAG: DNA polymerase III subunit delta [Clostridia bacterium]|nr:DNA polymerase III subunit delta [Clostridia bacterium]